MAPDPSSPSSTEDEPLPNKRHLPDHPKSIPAFTNNGEKSLKSEASTYVTQRNSNSWRLFEYLKGDPVHGTNDGLLKSWPHIDLLREATERHLPHLLFRTFSSASGGINGPTGFQSQAVKTFGSVVPLSSMSHEDVAENVKGHMQNGWRGNSHFISFTSSLLLALSLALKKKWELKQEDVCIAVFSTYDITEPADVFNAFQFLRAHGIENEKDKRNAIPEFFVWDELKVNSVVVKLDVLEANGLLDLISGLRTAEKTSEPSARTERRRKGVKPSVLRGKYYDHEYKREGAREQHSMLNIRSRWKRNNATRLRQPRKSNVSRGVIDDKRYALSGHHLDGFETLARVFGPRLWFPMMLYFLSTCTRYVYEDSIVDLAGARFRDYSSLSGFQFYTTGLETPKIPELQKFQNMMVQCCQKMRLETRTGIDRPQRSLMASTYCQVDFDRRQMRLPVSLEEAGHLLDRVMLLGDCDEDDFGPSTEKRPSALSHHTWERDSRPTRRWTGQPLWDPSRGQRLLSLSELFYEAGQGNTVDRPKNV